MTEVFVHPQAICRSQSVGEGTKVWAFAHVMEGAVVGKNCQICDQVFVEGGVQIADGVTVKNQVMLFEGVTLEEGVFVGPGAAFTNDRYPRSSRISGEPEVQKRYEKKGNWLVTTEVKRGASIGARATIMCGVTIGSFASVGSHCLVTKDVPDYALVVGVPARQIGWVCSCGVPLPRQGDLHCTCGKKFREENGTLSVSSS